MANSKPEPAPAPKSMSIGTTVGIVFAVFFIFAILAYVIGPNLFIAFQ